jgi:hypothetical protein
MESKRWLRVVSLVLAGVGLAGCTTAEATGPLTSPPFSASGAASTIASDRPTSSTQPSSAASGPDTRTGSASVTPPSRPAPYSSTPSSSATGRSGSGVSEVESAIDVTVPASLTAKQAADARAAIVAYKGFARLDDRAWADPQHDWSRELSLWAGGPLKISFLSDLAKAAKKKIHIEGTGSLVGTVTDVKAGIVTLAVCVDSSRVDIVDSKGKSVKAPNQSGSYWRSPGTVVIVKADTKDPAHEWLVSSLTFDHAKSC